MKIKFPLKNHILHRIYIYILAIVVVPIITSAIIIAKTNPKAVEKYSLFVGAYLSPQSSLKSKIVKYLEEFDDKEINLFAMDFYDTNYSLYYVAQGANSDLLILPEAALNELDLSMFAVINDDLEYYQDDNYINDEGIHYGINIGERLKEEIRYQNEKYYLCVRDESVHSLRFNETGKTSQTYTLIGKILNEE